MYINKTLINIRAKIYLNLLTRLKVIYLKLQQNRIIIFATQTIINQIFRCFLL